MIKQKECLSFDVLRDLPDQLMMGVTSLEVYNTVYKVTPINNFNKHEILLSEQQLKSYNIDFQLPMKVEYLYKFSDNDFVEKANKSMVDSYSKNRKLTRKDFDHLKKIIEAFNQQPTYIDKQISIISIPF